MEPSATTQNAEGVGPTPTVALRADMVALPITGENDFEFFSRNPGVMHSCGHDCHAAMLLGAANLLSGTRDEIFGEVRFLFQDAD